MLQALLAFGLIALAAYQVGRFARRIRLPLISGYLFTGIIAGPFLGQFISLEEIEHLQFLDEISLAVIAFAAGSELYLRELRSRLKSIIWHSAGQLIAIFLIGTAAMLMISNYAPFLQTVPSEFRLAIALLTGAILVARSPSSAIAIVNELRARGQFTKTLLGVTIVMDVVVVTFFALIGAIVDVVLTAEGFSILLIVLLALELTLSVVIGLLIGKVFEWVLASHVHHSIKVAAFVLIGLGIFSFSQLIREFTHEQLPFDILLEPLLIAMVASFFVTNFTRYRQELMEILEKIGPVIFLIFFTLVGEGLRLDILGQTLLVTIVLFAVRLVGLVVGSFVGGTIAGDPPVHRRFGWMAYVTQAGIGLGLAREAAAEFPQLGEEFPTLVISAIVLSQIVGPPFLSWVIKRVGEAHLPAHAEPDQVRDVLVLGMGGQVQALARQLKRHNWQVTIADLDHDQIELLDGSDVQAHRLTEISRDALAQVISTSTDAMVVMLGDDNLNLKACEIAYEHFGVPRLIARLNYYSQAEQFRRLGVHVVYPASAIVSLLDQFVRAPQTTALLLEDQPENDIVQITITNPDIHNVPLRDLRFPINVLVLGIVRDSTPIVPHGHTLVRLNDEMTLIGDSQSLEEVTLRLGF